MVCLCITDPLFQIKDLQEQQEKERVARGIENAEKLVRAEQLRDEKLAEIKRKVREHPPTPAPSPVHKLGSWYIYLIIFDRSYINKRF